MFAVQNQMEKMEEPLLDPTRVRVKRTRLDPELGPWNIMVQNLLATSKYMVSTSNVCMMTKRRISTIRDTLTASR